MNNRELNGRVTYLVMSLSVSLRVYNFKYKYSNGVSNSFNQWISQSYYHYRAIYNEAWNLLDMYKLRRHREHSTQDVFNQLPVYPEGMPLLEFQKYKGAKHVQK